MKVTRKNILVIEKDAEFDEIRHLFHFSQH